MKNLILLTILLIIAFCSCKKNEILPIDLKGTIQGTWYTRDEFGNTVDDRIKVVIQLEGSDPLIKTETDIEGRYVLNNIPTGTYNLIISKDGYGEFQTQGLQIVGGDEPLYSGGFLVQKSSTRVSNLYLELDDNGLLYLKGIIHQNNPWGMVFVRFYFHNSEDISSINYLKTMNLIVSEPNGSEFSFRLYDNYKTGDFASKLHAIAYGESEWSGGYYDIASQQYVITTLGEASNVAKIEFN
ncbi:carboxypeptidase-like regulatory domain-containing protein [Carboxylicivirga caseinilyticus]|uniref:carboxypeptidase-like regulatory domain-containing protein n=1 Tax=Carboxylicivirga caseinilyticus TaxID=3417572 RepID=UPI003D33BCC6|nr:carboxypeptidase regulatory-like domain-containing protein [Marinilabiliaceae bacterium A049]